jgi:hypothetical protein
MKLSSLLKSLAISATIASGSLFANSIQVYGTSDASIWAVTSDNGSFLTFCLEKAVDIHSATSYPYTVNTAAIWGGPNADITEIGFDTISQGTAALYLAFLNGTLPDANLIQSAIWALEDEISAPSAGVNAYYDWALSNFGTANYTGTEVKVINPWDWSTREKMDVQSVLVRVPDGGTTAILLGMGLVGMALSRRRK